MLHKHSNDSDHLKQLKTQELMHILPGAKSVFALLYLCHRIADQI